MTKDEGRELARRLLADGYNTAIVASRLQQRRMSQMDAAVIVQELTGKTVASRHPAGAFNMLVGGAIFGAGALVTLATLLSEKSSVVLFAWGAIAVGAGQFFAGLKQYRKPVDLKPGRE